MKRLLGFNLVLLFLTLLCILPGQAQVTGPATGNNRCYNYTTSAVGTVACTLGTAPAAGSLVTVHVLIGGSLTLTGISDGTTSYTLPTIHCSTTNQAAAGASCIAYLLPTMTGGTVITATVGGGNCSSTCSITVDNFAVAHGTLSFDTSAIGNGTGAVTTPSISPASTFEFFYAGCTNANSCVGTGSTWTQEPHNIGSGGELVAYNLSQSYPLAVSFTGTAGQVYDSTEMAFKFTPTTTYSITAVRIDGAPAATLTGTGTSVTTTLTSTGGSGFTAGEVGEGIIFNGSTYTIASYTNSTTVTLSSSAGTAGPAAYSILQSTCNTTHACDGWVAEVDVSTIGAAGLYALGVGQGNNNSPSAANIVFTVTSKGYKGGSNCGTATTYTRKVYATHVLREPNPNYATNDDALVSGTFTTRLSLSDRIYSSDTVTVTVAAGFYQDLNGNENNSYSGTPTNNSTLAYVSSRALFNWTYPGWQRVTGSTFTVRGTGFSQYPMNSLPIACVVFYAQDAHNNVASATVGTPTIDPTLKDQVPIVEYLGSLSTSSFTNHDQIIACFRAYPWIGDETATMDSCDATVTGSVGSGTFQAGEQVKQATTLALAYLDNIPVSSGNMIVGSIISQTSAADSSHTWTGQTSGATYTPSTAPAYVNPQPSPLYSPAYFLLDTTNAYSAAAYVDSSATFPGSHTSGTFVAGEKLTQSTSSATAYLIDVTGANGAGPIHVGGVVSGTFNTTSGKTWTGATSGAVFTQSGAPTYAGVDTNSCAVAESAWNYMSPPSPCRTLNGAAVKMAAYNNASSTPTHNDACGTMYLNTGYYTWMGASANVSNTTGKCWATITPITGSTEAQVVIDGFNGSQGIFGSSFTLCQNGAGLSNCGTPIHVKGVTVNVATGPVSLFNNDTYLWLDNMSLSCGGTAPIYQVTELYVTQSVIPSTLAGNGLRNFGGGAAAMAPAIVRGNDLSTVGGGGVLAYTFVGNTNKASQNFYIESESASSIASTMPIVAFNTMYYWNAGGSNGALGLTYTTSNIIGEAVVQNLWENVNNGDTLVAVGLSADSSSANYANNVMIWLNDVVGGRMNRAYNDNGVLPLFRQSWSEIGNIMDTISIKTDTFTTANANRIGNWATLYGSGSRSNYYIELANLSATGAFCNEFVGLNTYYTTLTGGQPLTCAENSTVNLPGYKTRAAFTGSAGGSGGGNYSLLSNSPVINFFPAGTQVLPYDIAGQVRNNSGYGAAGAYEQAILTPTFGW